MHYDMPRVSTIAAGGIKVVLGRISFYSPFTQLLLTVWEFRRRAGEGQKQIPSWVKQHIYLGLFFCKDVSLVAS